MQIHELTKLQRTDEGLLDGVKAAVRTAKAGYKAGGIGGAAKTLSDPRAFARQQNAVYKQKNKADLAALADKMNKGKKPGSPGYWIAPGQAGYDEQQAAKQLSKNPKAAQKVNQYTAAFQNTFSTAPTPYDPSTGQHSQANTVLPDPNKTLMVTARSGGNYYKTINGKWYSERGEVVPDPSGLEKMIDDDQYKQVGIPGVIQAKLKATPPVAPTPSAATVKEAAPTYSPGAQARRATMKSNVAQTPSTETPATDEHLPLSKFSQWADAKIPELKGAEQDPDLKPEVDAIEKSTDVKQAAPLFKKLLTKALTTGNDGAGSVSGSTGAVGGPVIPADQLLKTIKDQGINGLNQVLSNDRPRQKTGSRSLDNLLDKAGLLETELHKELQAFKAGK